MRSKVAIATFLCAALWFMPSARADDIEGTVVGTDASDLVVDLGSTRGASDGMVVELWRPLHIKHPVTGKILTDRFLIGRLRLLQVRPNLALAQPDGALSRPAMAGDVVLMRGPAATPSPLPSSHPTPLPRPIPPPGVPDDDPSLRGDPDAALLSALFDSLKGSSPETRAKRYEDFAREHKTSRFVMVLREEAAALRSNSAPAQTRAQPQDEQDPLPLVLGFAAPETAFSGAPLHFAIELRRDVQGGVLYARAASGETFEVFPMRSVGDGYFEAELPARLVQAPSFAYFIEAIDGAGKKHAVEGSSEAPLTTQVEDMPMPTRAVPIQAQIAIWTDFAVWNTKKLNDYASQTEGVFGVRFMDVGVRAVRSGFGVYRGIGGSLAALDQLGSDPRSVGLTYGSLETELAPVSSFSFVLRGLVGLGQDGIGGGFQGFVRIGNDLKTNLLVGGEGISGVGLRAIAQLEWSAASRWPIMFRTEVTNQPAGSAGGDVGVRLIAQGGYHLSSHLTVALRVSYQGRTINHAGPGGGAAVAYQW